MPALAFGLGSSASKSKLPSQSNTKPTQKRKGIFADEDDNDEYDETDGFSKLAKPTSSASKMKSQPALNKSIAGKAQPPRKSPKLVFGDDDEDTTGKQDLDGSNGNKSSNKSAKYTNLSALRSAKLQDEEASKLDASVYDYDAVYDTFNAAKEKKSTAEGGEASGPKYMTSLLASAEVRKRDQLRAKEKQLQREREAEGDEFADKEKFVTSAYKKQQEEMRQAEENEKKREAEEEEKRRKGGGMMTDFHKKMLLRDEERSREMEKAVEELKAKKESGINDEKSDQMEVDEEDDKKVAEKLNQKGGNVVVNDEGEVVDKRQLLGAGLNVAPKKPAASASSKRSTENARPQEYHRSTKAQDARLSQRERQSRMVERQIEEMAEKQREAEQAERKELEEKNKSKITEDAKTSALERYKQRKKEREEAAKKEKAGG